MTIYYKFVITTDSGLEIESFPWDTLDTCKEKIEVARKSFKDNDIKIIKYANGRKSKVKI